MLAAGVPQCAPMGPWYDTAVAATLKIEETVPPRQLAPRQLAPWRIAARRLVQSAITWTVSPTASRPLETTRT